LITHDI
jgi:hypothetical protein